MCCSSSARFFQPVETAEVEEGRSSPTLWGMDVSHCGVQCCWGRWMGRCTSCVKTGTPRHVHTGERNKTCVQCSTLSLRLLWLKHSQTMPRHGSVPHLQAGHGHLVWWKGHVTTQTWVRLCWLASKLYDGPGLFESSCNHPHPHPFKIQAHLRSQSHQATCTPGPWAPFFL